MSAAVYCWVPPLRSAPSEANCSCPQGFEGDAELEAALKGCDLVIIPAGVPRKPGMTRDDLFKVGWKLSCIFTFLPCVLCRNVMLPNVEGGY